ncbi:relaxase/mobilization nuclease domain-containing protein [Echinicola marina]|uniref:relaxase/mobilization nuclease domain-containing protein n=1 Tax=Echinicola marina TaxID=2859768 RepID=UPI001CF6DD97|nr:relaxase/mobilization nuclease domain-containing protein [Echinicola marina]UCS92412.1 relaxase/mobilization nuclease domain-containing protein [Echinicola marina]
MVAKISLGRNILGLLYYNEEKVQEGKGILLSANGFGANAKEGSISEKHRRFRFFTDQNQRAKLNAFHVSLNFSPKESLDKDQLRFIAQEYMQRIGFGAQPYLVYEHFDAGHQHVHIVSTNITTEGKRIETHNLGREKSEKARKELEVEIGLVKAAQQKEQIPALRPLEKVEYGKRESKAAMSNVITEVMRTYAYASLSEFSAILKQFNIGLIQGEEGSKMRTNKGLAYSILDKEGKRIGVPIKASAFYARPTMGRLEKRMERNRKTKEKLVPGARKVFGSILQDSMGKGKAHFERALYKKGFVAEFHYSKTREVFGLSLIDHQNRAVFKASELSRNWSGKKVIQMVEDRNGLLERPSITNHSSDFVMEDRNTNGKNQDRQEAPVWKVEGIPVLMEFLSLLESLGRPESQELNEPFEQRKKKRKRRKLN